jgi:3-oxoacyl-[acyl-carrier-protein] synthase-3
MSSSLSQTKTIKAYIRSISTHLPIETRANDPNDKLTKKTGIYSRHIAADDEFASDLAYRSAEKLFTEFDIDRNAIDFTMLCTQSPDYFLPTTACILQERLCLKNQSGAFDFNLGCSGYIYGLSLAKGLIETNQAKNILLLTSDTYTKYINPRDRATEPLFGDGASATLISGVNTDTEGLYGFEFGTDGSGADNFIVRGGASRIPPGSVCYTSASNKIFMDGPEIARFALRVVPITVNSILQKCKLAKGDIDYYIFHQANKFILNFLREKCELSDASFYNCAETYGNTVSTSIPIAVNNVVSSTANKGDLKKVMLVGFGVGFSWGGCIVDLSKLLGKS